LYEKETCKLTEQRNGIAEEVVDHVENRIQEYRKFAFKDDMLKLAIAFILGGAFSKTVTAISEYLIMPILNFALHFTGENWRTATWEPVEGLILEIGKFGAAAIDFLLISIVLFYMWKIARAIQEGQPINIWKKIFPWRIKLERRSE
jgi:large conductance mechanosensitive channel